MPEVAVKSYVRNGRLVRAYRRVGKPGRGQAIQAPAGGASQPTPRGKMTAPAGKAGGRIAAAGDVTNKILAMINARPGSVDYQPEAGSKAGKWVDTKTGKVLGYSVYEDSRIFTTPAAAEAWNRKQKN